MILLIDIGNTRVKWAMQEAGCLGPQHAEPHTGWSLDDVHEHITAATAAPERVIVSNVGGPRMATLLTDAVAQAWGIQPVFVQASSQVAGVHNAYAEPAKLGVDRWLALIAAHRMVAGAACVVSIGTAMTIDGIDPQGRHLGGLITPGPQLMVQSLLGGTSDIAARAGVLQATEAILATDTAAGIHNGARHALAALIVRVAECIRLQANRSPEVILTGGAAVLVVGLLPWTCQLVPDLVLRELAILANEA